MEKPEDFEEKRQQNYRKYREAVKSELDPVMVILRTHLFSENLLEEIIMLRLPRGDRIMESANLTYNQKLVLVNSFDRLSDNIYCSLKNLNKIRNECAHRLDKSITDSDVTRIGSSLGKEFTNIKKNYSNDVMGTLIGVLDYVIGALHGSRQYAEDTHSKN